MRHSNPALNQFIEGLEGVVHGEYRRVLDEKGRGHAGSGALRRLHLRQEPHPDPDRAPSDGPNMLPLEALRDLMARAVDIWDRVRR